MKNNKIERFIKSLKNSPDRDDLFNPWWESDTEHDIGPEAPIIRRKQLAQYLKERISRARHIIIGEAVGYQGGHFTGMAMTSERLLLGGLKHKGLLPEHVFKGIKPQRTSRANIKKGGFSEPTATIVWGHIIESSLDPYKFIIWNALPWHPFDPAKGKLSNRTPDKNEFQDSSCILKNLIDIYNFRTIIAVGNKSYEQLSEMGIRSHKVRHPANGGAGKFRKEFSHIINS